MESGYTPNTGPFPPFINFRGEDGGDTVRVTVRGPSTSREGIRVCGLTCHPGKMGCNNYCNLHPNRDNMDMPDSPEPFTYVDAGPLVSFEVEASELKTFLTETLKNL